LTNRLDPTTKQISTYLASSITDETKCLEIFKILVAFGANPHFIDGMKQSVLFYLAKEGHASCIKLILDKGLNPNQTDIHGQTPIYYAARDGKVNIIS
jgi:ankyrin repeat protein